MYCNTHMYILLQLLNNSMYCRIASIIPIIFVSFTLLYSMNVPFVND